MSVLDLTAAHEPPRAAHPPAATPHAGAGALAARDIWFSYDGRAHALRGVDVTVEPGKITMILGRSGSGKTTLLKVLNGLLPPQRGEVRLAHTNGRPARSRVAYVPQNLGLVRSMTALENALMGALSYTGTLRSALRLFPRSTVEQAAGTLEALGLAQKARVRVYALSGGERQRVAVARALMQRPDVILADEFVSQLDAVTTDELLVLIRAIVRSGVGLLITTHEFDIVTEYADRLIVMRDGSVAYDGDAAALTAGAMKELLR
jgi:phosphonate transport system ATP-binding protein